MEAWQTTTLDQFKDEASCFKVIKLILTDDYINKTEILSTLKSRLAKMYKLFNNDLQQDAHECLCLIYDTLEIATSILINSDINVAIFKEYVSGLINNYIICMECKCKTTYNSTMHEIIINIKGNIHMAIKDSLDTKISKIYTKCKQSKWHKLKQTFSPSPPPPKILMVNINRFDNNNRKLNNVMCITESINIDSHQANLKAFIQHYETNQNGHYTSTIKKGNTWYNCNDSQSKETNLN